jgi:predicted DNA-binding transcriptional regulator AlpA
MTMFTILQFCEYAKISTRHFHTLKAQGLGPDLVRIGRSVRITEEAAKEWIKKHTERPA